jgi:endonuclease/exonuclease/phosphatase family metal-dependent hydrolase
MSNPNTVARLFPLHSGLMKTIILFCLLIIPALARAKAPLKLMNFNIMCVFCGDKEEYGSYKQRMAAVADTINRHDPDILSLQEFTRKCEVKKLLKKLKSKYEAIYYQGVGVSFVDPVLLVKKDRFEVAEEKSFWLGPNPKLPLGWKTSFPRRLQWAEIYDKTRGERFVLAGSHFDNSSVNKEPSAMLTNEYFKDFKYPVIFAGDTNLKTVHAGYTNMLGDVFVDTFPGVDAVKYVANGPFTVNDGCNASKDPLFPQCRVEHVLTSKNAPWVVKSWSLDVFRYHGKTGFVSDHRAVIVELE